MVLVPITAYADELSIDTAQISSTSDNTRALAIDYLTSSDVDGSNEGSDITLLTTASGLSISADNANAIANGTDALEFIIDFDNANSESGKFVIVFAERNGSLSEVDNLSADGATAPQAGVLVFTSVQAGYKTIKVTSTTAGTVTLKAYLITDNDGYAADKIVTYYSGDNSSIKCPFVGNGCSGNFSAPEITSLALDQKSIRLNSIGEQATLNVVVLPENADKNAVSWSSSNESIATVNNGVVKAVANGQAIITAQTLDGKYQDTCTVTVRDTTIQAVVPIFSVPSGTIIQGNKVSLSTETAGAQIYYTLDGSDPDETAQLYQNPLVINENVTIKAIAIKAGLQNSPIATANYRVITDLQPVISVGTKKVYSGNEASIAISIKNNPGLVSMRLKVSYDNDALTLLRVEDKGLLGNEMHSDNLSAMPYTLFWKNGSTNTDYVDNGEIVILTFAVAENAEVGYYPISISYDSNSNDIINKDLEDVELAIINGGIYVSDILLGDVNSDGKVTPLDDIYLARYLADWSGYAEKVDLLAADVNNDGKVTPVDNVILARYLASWQGYESLPYIK